MSVLPNDGIAPTRTTAAALANVESVSHNEGTTKGWRLEMLQRLSVDEYCYDKVSCQSVWGDDENVDDLIIVGPPAPSGTVPLADGEVAIRIRRRIVADAKIGR